MIVIIRIIAFVIVIAWMVAASRLIRNYEQTIKELEYNYKTLEMVVDMQCDSREELEGHVEFYKQGLDECLKENVKLLKLLNNKGVR